MHGLAPRVGPQSRGDEATARLVEAEGGQVARLVCWVDHRWRRAIGTVHRVEVRADGDMDQLSRRERGEALKQALGQALGGSHEVEAKKGKGEEDEGSSEEEWIEKAKQDEGILKQLNDMTGQRLTGLISVLVCCSGQAMGRTCHRARRQAMVGASDWCATRGQRFRQGQRTFGGVD